MNSSLNTSNSSATSSAYGEGAKDGDTYANTAGAGAASTGALSSTAAAAATTSGAAPTSAAAPTSSAAPTSAPSVSVDHEEPAPPIPSRDATAQLRRSNANAPPVPSRDSTAHLRLSMASNASRSSNGSNACAASTSTTASAAAAAAAAAAAVAVAAASPVLNREAATTPLRVHVDPQQQKRTSDLDYWREFCDENARADVTAFAKQSVDFIPKLKLPLHPRQLLDRYVSTFETYFESEYARIKNGNETCSEAENVRPTTLRIAPKEKAVDVAAPPAAVCRPVSPRSHYSASTGSMLSPKSTGSLLSPKSNESMFSPKSTESLLSPTSRMAHTGAIPKTKSPNPKPFFRRLSLRKLRNKKKPMQATSDADGDEFVPVKLKWFNPAVECHKKGYVHYLSGESIEQLHSKRGEGRKWEKCKLALLLSSCGYMLEFYLPKATSPVFGLYCLDIKDLRETTASEFPDRKNAFVMTYNHWQYVVDTADEDELHGWLVAIRSCMKQNSTRNPRPSSNVSFMLNPMGPPRIGPRMPPSSYKNPADVPEPDAKVVSNLIDFNWYHHGMTRDESVKYVLEGGHHNHGRFAVRPSETRPNQFVLSFNFDNKPKHFQMAIGRNGDCRLEDFCFQTMNDMLAFFGHNTIPEASGGRLLQTHPGQANMERLIELLRDQQRFGCSAAGHSHQDHRRTRTRTAVKDGRIENHYLEAD